MVKADKRYGSWCVANCIPRQQKLFKKLNTPLIVTMNALVTHTSHMKKLSKRMKHKVSE